MTFAFDIPFCQVIGIDKLSGCKDPERQHLLLIDHISRIRQQVHWCKSPIKIFVEHNLGFEAEHHERALRGLPGTTFYKDEKRQRVGVLTTLPVKHAMCCLTNALLREDRVTVLPNDKIVSLDPVGVKKLLMDELGMYSYQFKGAATPFTKDQMALSGKFGGQADDLAILFQLAIYWTHHVRTAAVD